MLMDSSTDSRIVTKIFILINKPVSEKQPCIISVLQKFLLYTYTVTSKTLSLLYCSCNPNVVHKWQIHTENIYTFGYELDVNSR